LGGVVRVLIADDHRLTLEAVKAALVEAEGVKIVAEASSGRQALAEVARTRPDVALIDMRMPGAIDGLTCAERIRKTYPEIKVVVLSAFTDEACVRMAFRRGAHAFISKGVDPNDLGATVRLCVRGTVFHAPIDNGSSATAGGLVEGLTEREATVLKAVAAGLSNQAISKRLWVTEHTVKFHLTNIFRKLDVSNRTEAARWAQQHGLVEDLMTEVPAAALQPALAPTQPALAPA
jgi:DNA-binding NarL/FixJ family response regulator